MSPPDAAGPQKLLGLIDYQDRAVVSHTILNKATGTVTVFAFDEGEGLTEHAAAYDAMVQVLEGRIDISVGGEEHSLAAGEWILLPAEVPHALKAVSRSKMLLTMIKS